jgi:hypothetical protein
VSSWLLTRFQPCHHQTGRHTFSVPNDFIHTPHCTWKTRQALKVDGATFYELDDLIWITDPIRFPLPSGPEHSRTVVYCRWQDVPSPSRTHTNNCFVVAYIRANLPEKRHRRAKHQVYDARGVRPTMTSHGQGALFYHQRRWSPDLHAFVQVPVVRTSTRTEDISMWGLEALILARRPEHARAQLAKAQDPDTTCAIGASMLHVLDSAQCLDVPRLSCVRQP